MRGEMGHVPQLGRNAGHITGISTSLDSCIQHGKLDIVSTAGQQSVQTAISSVPKVAMATIPILPESHITK